VPEVYQRGGDGVTYSILLGDVLDQLATLPDESIQCVITSPPYYGLRDYGTATWEGGSPDCDHQGKPMATKASINKNCGTGEDVKNAASREFFKDICGKCGAKRIDKQIGLEATPQEYLAKMTLVFREIRRVLRKDGTAWVNMGDSYSSGSTPQGKNGQMADRSVSSARISRPPIGQPKQLMGMPWRLALALQDDGWILRQDIIWAKPNPMPESVTDRCTKSHEYIFLLSKSLKYYCSEDGMKEPAAPSSKVRLSQNIKGQEGSHRVPGKTNGTMKAVGDGENRNRRSVWTVPTCPYEGAHYATFPPELIRPMVLAGCPASGTILDPFGGSGTTAQVALEEGRNCILIELNPVDVDLIKKRLAMIQRRLDRTPGEAIA
jgi:DNA modification methylase